MKLILKLLLLVAPLLALVPVAGAVPTLKAEYEQFAHQWLNRHALAAPAVTFNADEQERYKPLPVIEDAVPVLTYHGINDKHDEYSVTQKAFERQITMLDQAGYETISMEQFVRWMRHEPVKLPERPILLTFDDGRLDSFRGADKVLAEHDFRATMFVITGTTDREIPFHLYWHELREMEDSGRWDLQLHAHDGHVRFPTTKDGGIAPYYANRKWLPHINRLESIWHWKDRVDKDLDTGERLMDEQLDDYKPLAFALPYGNYGEDGTNDPRIPGEMAERLTDRYEVAFDTKRMEYAIRTPAAPEDCVLHIWHKKCASASPAFRVPRYELHTDSTASQLYDWLREALPEENKDKRGSA